MKNLFTVVLLAVLCFTASAQKVKKDNSFGEWFYIQIPANYTLEGVKTYNVVAVAANADAYRRDQMTKILVETPLSMDFRYNSKGGGDVTIKVEEYPLKYAEPELITLDNSKKDKDGNVIRTISYYYKCRISFKYILEILNQDGELLYTKKYASLDDISGASNAEKKIAGENLEKAKKDHESKIINEKVKELIGFTKEEVGYTGKWIDGNALYVKSKKYEYPEFEAVYEKMLEIRAIRDDRTSGKPNWNKIDALLWEVIMEMTKVLKESDPENKKARINKDVTAAAYYNMGICYFILKKYNEADESFGKAIEFDKGIANAKYIKSKTEKMLERMAIKEEL